MNIKQIITDPTDCDVYKFSMSNFLYKQGYLRDIVGWSFFNRGEFKFPKGYGKELQRQVDSWHNMKFTEEQLSHLSNVVHWLDHFYIWAYLKTYEFDTSSIQIVVEEFDDYEDVKVSYEDEWGKVIFFEIYLLATMSELYSIMSGLKDKVLSKEKQEARNKSKFKKLEEIGAMVAEFGTRRRFSKQNQEDVIKQMIKYSPTVLQGTSNVMFARELNLVPIGTLAHELVMFVGAKYGPTRANEVLMSKWVEVYNGALGTYVPDTYTTKHFLRYFDLLNSKLWDGVREDSAPDTDEFVDMMIDHYKRLRIDPSSKYINHSNGINSIEKIKHMHSYRKGEIKRNFGIGTWLTNDVYTEESNIKPVDWVIKMTHTYQDDHKKYCIKLSDVQGKVTSISDETTERYKNELNL